MYYELYLPFPPTINNYYLNAQSGGRYISRAGREFRELTVQAITEQLPNICIDYRMLVEAVIFPPDRHIRDIMNYEKALSDAITHSGLWVDDSLIDQFFMYRGQTRPRNASVYVRISEAGPVITDVRQLPES